MLNATNPVAGCIYIFPNVSANANFVMTEGIQTINKLKDLQVL
jgi:hypothetical protein